MSTIFLAVALQGASAFDTSLAAFVACERRTVQMGMMTKMPPAAFEAGLARSCTDEEAAFRAAAVRRAIELGRTPEAAATEVDGNIANGRRLFARDQATYVATGRVPR